MDSRLLIGPGIPTPDPTSRAPWLDSSISPHRLMELSPAATAVSITLSACLFVFLLCCLGGGLLGGDTPLCSRSMWNIWQRGNARSLTPFPQEIIHKNLRDDEGGMRVMNEWPS